MKTDYRVSFPVESELYEAWKKHCKLIYGIGHAAPVGGITAKNSEVFCNEIKRLMRYEKGNTGKKV